MDCKATRQGSIPQIRSTERWQPPAWAVLERLLIDVMNEAAPEFVDRYTRSDGTLIWKKEWPGMDGSDDAYESFHNFPLLYALGGSEKLHEIARKEWDVLTWQWTEYGQIYREFDAYYDWMHHGESSLYVYYYGLADPTVLKDRQRTLRFAGMYTGEDPEADNYDPDKRLIRSPINGSRGPRFEMTAEDWSTHRDVLDNYLPPFEDIPGVEGPKCPWSDDQVFGEILRLINERMARGDVPLNLNATSLITHAFMYTGDPAYKRWVREYLEAWREYTHKNGGIIPDNIGLSGEIGEYMDGKWWGGYYGWRWPHGANTIIEPLLIAGMNAALLTGHLDHLDLARSQLDLLWELGKKEDGEWMVPNRRFDDGWGDFRPMKPSWAIQCWSFSRTEEDLSRVLRLRKGKDWNTVNASVGKGNRGPICQWFNYIQGENPGYPEEILRANYQVVCEHLETIRSDDGDPEDYGIHHWQNVNPVITEALVQLTLGAPQNIYHGGLLHAPVRYYDLSGKRPGLPESVGALVETVDEDGVTLNLVNLDPGKTRELVIQAGTFGQDSFRKVEVLSDGAKEGEMQELNCRWLAVELFPGCGVKLRLTADRYTNTPTYETPWVTDDDYPPVLCGRRD